MEQRLEFGALREPPSAIIQDLLADEPRAREFFPATRVDLAALVERAQAVSAFPHDRPRLVQALERQQRSRGAERAALRARQLLDPRSVAIVTGQQAVLFGGPLLVLYKALTTLRLARELEPLHGAPVVPVFWVASDDHDFEEIRAIDVTGEDGQLQRLRYTPASEPALLPAARLQFDESVTALVVLAQQTLPGSPNLSDAIAALSTCYWPGASLAEAFARFLSQALPELVVLDPADAELRALMLPVMERELVEHSPSSRLASEVGLRLEAAGYHQQVQVRDGFLNLFAVEDGERRALALKHGRIQVRGLDREWELAAAVEQLHARPLDFSPGALLRPLAQDLLLPTAAYVGGPAELAYHTQIGTLYAHFGIPRPLLVPRASLTLVEAAQARALEAEGVTLLELQGDVEALVARFVHGAHPEIDGAFSQARAAIQSGFAGVGQVLGALDSTLGAAAENASGRAAHQLEGLLEKAMRALKKREETRAQRLRRAQAALFPDGGLQERRLGWLGLVSRHGFGIIAELERRLDPWARDHQVVTL